MSGSDALRGYQYQLWSALHYILRELEDPGSDVSAVVVESPNDADQFIDSDIVDFALLVRSRPKLVAQVKSSRTAKNIGGPSLLRSILRLANSSDCQRYLLVTNQLPSTSARDVQLALEQESAWRSLRIVLAEAAEHSPKVAQQLLDLDDTAAERLTRCRVVFDSRGDDEVREGLRNRVRRLRKQLGVRTGPDSSGLLVGHLVARLLQGAAEESELSMDYLRGELATPTGILLQAWGRRDFGRIYGAPPRLGEVGRPELVREIENTMNLRAESDGVPCVVLVGPSGIGKSNLALEYICANADSYDDIYWLDASSPPRIRLSLEQIARGSRENIDVGPQQDEELTTYVHSFLASRSSPWALVLDNAPSRTSIEKLIPPLGLGATIITCTDKLGWNGPRMVVNHVPAMTSEQARSLLQLRLRPGAATNVDRDLEYIAQTFDHWPLALELGANYLRSCNVEVQDAREFLDEFKLRALQDEHSTPVGYPTTLVAALRATFGRLNERSATDEMSDLALVMIRFAAYTLGRQIPVDLLLESSLVTPWDATSRGLHGPRSWRVPGFPLAEILRAVERDFLMRKDEPLDLGLDELKPSLQINEVVQTVVRDLINESDPTGEAENLHLFNLAFYLQSWLSWFTEHDAVFAMTPIVSHAKQVAEFALRNERANFGLALLWGNLAAALRAQERFGEAVRYLEAELQYLDREPENRALLRIQTRVSLAESLWREGPDDGAVASVGAVGRLLGECQNLIPLVEAGQQGKLMNACIGAIQLLEMIERHSLVNLDCTGLSRAFWNVVRTGWSDSADLPADGLVVSLYVFASSDEHEKVVELASRGLADARIGGHLRPMFLRLLAEAQAVLGEWVKIDETLHELVVESRTHRLSDSDASIIFINVGLAAVLAADFGVGDALQAQCALTVLVKFMDEYELIRRPLTEADAACVAILRAADAFSAGNYALQDAYLESVDFAPLDTVDPKRARGWRMAFHRVAFADRDRRVRAGTYAPPNLENSIEVTNLLGDLLRRVHSAAPTDMSQALLNDSIPVGESVDGSVVTWGVFDASGTPKNGLICAFSAEVVLNVIGSVMLSLKARRNTLLVLLGCGDAPMLGRLSPYFDLVALDERAMKSIWTKLQGARPGSEVQALGGGDARSKVLLIVDSTDGSLQSDLATARALEDVAIETGPSNVGVLVVCASTSLHGLGGRRVLRDVLAKDNLLVSIE